ncbi:chromosome partition protein smc [hydrocarbon metagenome]|uniref:Chromosome partition protein smc n=1 Tax=hydrocarbon metagenome TaxID=938273 RepID=A0A0W8E3T7_9ZZZZ
MYLKRMDIKGFKTFADSTEVLLQPGINMIVGPNGCGKSNIVDAIRWCLGESNVRNLRGHRGEDVIFNGTDDKRAQGMAFVELSIDNGDQALPVDYNEITISRKLFRSGESEFYINKSRVRMKDIASMFTGTGLGKKGYSIISQGELEQVLNGQPLDRRFILEEASGIIKYRHQRDEVRTRLTNTGNDLTRLRDILTELKQRRDELENKAERARRHISFNTEKRQMEEDILRFEIYKMHQDLVKKNEALLDKKEGIEDLRRQVQEKEDTIAREEIKLLDYREMINSLRDDRHETDNRLSALENEIRLSEERIKNYAERAAAAVEDEDKYQTMLQKINEDLKARLADYEGQKNNFMVLTDNFEQLNLQILALEDSMQDSMQHFEEKKSRIFERMQEESRINNKVLEVEESQRKLREKKERTEILSSDLRVKINQKEAMLNNMEQEKKQFGKEIGELGRNLEKIENSKQELEGLQKANAVQYALLSEDELKIDKKLLLIDDMERNMEGYSRGVKAVLEAAEKGRLSGIRGLVGEVIDVPVGLETAIETALGRRMENIIVKNSESARQAIEYLKKTRLGRLTFLPLDILLSSPVPPDIKESLSRLDGVLGLASDLIQYQQEYKKAVRYLLGRVLLVKDMETGIKVFKSTSFPLQIVTLDGELINVSGAMTGGSYDKRRETPLQRKKEKKNLLEQQTQVKLSLLQNRQESEDINRELDKVQKQVETQKNALMEKEFRFEIIDKQASQTNDDVQNDRKEWEASIERLVRLETSYEELLLEMEDLQMKKDSIHSSSESESEELEELKEKIDVYKRNYEVNKERLLSYQEQIDSKKRELESIEKNITQFKQVESSYQQSRLEAAELKSRLADLDRSETDKMAVTRIKISEEKQALSLIQDQIAAQQEEEKQCSMKISSIRQEISPLRQNMIQLENNSRNTEIGLARLETEFEAMKSRWRQEYDKQLDDIGEPQTNASQIRDFRQRVELLSNQLEEIGPVDLESIGEFEAINERFGFINQQYEDLLTARDSLNNLLQETEKLMSREFTDFMRIADQSFAHTFQDIFGGGEACLRMEQGKDRLEAGLDIEVKLPGKKTQSLNLLSGGERALTCIAFIFSLLRLKPAPFCILDEIDASLDETNLIRFSEFLKKMAQEMQYIIITHRQSTIESGENIYGVTMSEKGVSKVLTLNIKQEESRAG